MKTRVAIYAEAPPGWGGSFQYATSILDAVAALDRNAYDIRVWCRHPAWPPLIAAKQLNSVMFGGGLHDLSYRGISRTLAHIGARNAAPNLVRCWEKLQPAARDITRWKADICINLQQTSLGLPPHVRQISPIHDLMHLYETRFPEVAERTEWLARQWLFGNIALRCTKILVDSPTGARHVMDKFSVPADQLVVLPFIAPSSLLTAQPKRPPSLSTAVKEDGFIFYPAQFWQHKNHVGLLEAIASIKHAAIPCVFTGTTDKNGYQNFTKAVARLGLESRVYLLGYVDDAELCWLYRNARLMAMPTFLGPTNIPPLEAMSLDCPVAISNVYGMREQLRDAALYFDPNNTADMANVLKHLWDSARLRDALREKGRLRIASWNTQHFEKAVQNIIMSV